MTIRAATPEVGALIGGRYRVEGTLGQGGMGVVLSVREESTREPLAIKLLGVRDGPDGPEATEDTAERAARLSREAQAAMRIASEHVVRVRDVSSGDPELGPYIVMERLEGIDLAEAWPIGEKMPITDAADLGMQVCEALSHAHAAGIVHRDIKPSNLFLAHGPTGEIIKVLDFGISKLTSRAEWERTQGTLTFGDAVLGSPQFVSPEQLRDSSSVDARTDIWSLGVVLYRLMTGVYPFTGDTIGQLFTRILERDPASISAHGVESEAMQRIVSRCLSRDLDGRYADAGELARDLEPLASERWASLADAIQGRSKRRPTGRPQSMPAPSGKRTTSRAMETASPASGRWTARRRVPTIAAGFALLAGIGVSALTLTRHDERATNTDADSSGVASLSVAAPAASVTSNLAAPGASVTTVSPASHPPAPAAVSSGVVEITISADAPIEKVRAMGLRRVTIEKDTATLILAEWNGTLDIDAELAGGKAARATITTDGPRAVRLVPVSASTPRPQAARPVKVAGTEASSSASAAPAAPSGLALPLASGLALPLGASASGGTELHANPYARPSSSSPQSP